MRLLGDDARYSVLGTAKTGNVAVALEARRAVSTERRRHGQSHGDFYLLTLTFLRRHRSHAVCTRPPLVTSARGRKLGSTDAVVAAFAFGFGTTRNIVTQDVDAGVVVLSDMLIQSNYRGGRYSLSANGFFRFTRKSVYPGAGVEASFAREFLFIFVDRRTVLPPYISKTYVTTT